MSKEQISSNLGEESLQAIFDADTMVSTSSMSSTSDKDEDLEQFDTKRVAEVEQTFDTDSEEIEWIKETSKVMMRASYNGDWDTFEKFLLDESISKRKKKLVLDEYEEFAHLALSWEAPLAVIKYLVELEGAEMISKGRCSWLHTAIMCIDTTFEVVKLLVDIGGKDLVMMQSNDPKHRKRTALHIHLGLSRRRTVELNEQITELLLRIGGVELLDIEDEDGYRIVDYCSEHERNIIIKCLRSSYDKNVCSVQQQERAFQSVKVSPKQVEEWICNENYTELEIFLDNKEVSEEVKQRCFNYRESGFNRVAFFYFCMLRGPLHIAKRIIDLMGTDFHMAADNNGETFLHEVCTSRGKESNVIRQHELIHFLIEQGGTALLCATDCYGRTALHCLMISCNRVNFDSITLMTDVGGKDFLFETEDMSGRTVLHFASRKKELNKDVLLYLISKGGSALCDVKDYNGKKAEDYWSPELKQYINLCTKTSDLPALSDDLQCPICLEIMNDVHIIPQCCHRFCKKCITDAFHRNGKKCPVCRAEYLIGEVRRDPLLCKFAILAQEKDAELTKAKKELETLKRKYNEI
ncbi:hypothetical protein CTEN210_13625 [Chaetoceros tenuissimus]|uniref:RING-type domain-containing protein n=1 Tax=Chaetoceros tenuissimus TaxID=426638 RepID=A0AAD3D6Z9_9STRA|nr:hypothetical protein CTEN210_13625 [Chaetoceros tenuissimus]